MKGLIIASAAIAAGIVAVPASAETLNVQGVVAPYCNVNLTNVSSGTASVAMAGVQTVANLRLSCNAVSAPSSSCAPRYGDLLQTINGMEHRINYDVSVDSASDSAFNIPRTTPSPAAIPRIATSSPAPTRAIRKRWRTAFRWCCR